MWANEVDCGRAPTALRSAYQHVPIDLGADEPASVATARAQSSQTKEAPCPAPRDTAGHTELPSRFVGVVVWAVDVGRRNGAGAEYALLARRALQHEILGGADQHQFRKTVGHVIHLPS
jgi:hypothetical protein